MSQNRQLDFETGRRLLESYNIIPSGRVVADLDQALALAKTKGWPVVIKAQSDKIVHKTDLGAVRLNIKNAGELAREFKSMNARLAQAGVTEIDGILVQTMARSGFELLIGAKQDPVFGPVTMVGSGGKYVELLQDVSPGIGVLTEDEVEGMLADTKAGRIIDGYRGEKLDKAAVIGLVVSVSKLMADHPEIRELDLNPVIVHEQGYDLVDARLIARENHEAAPPKPVPSEPDPRTMASLDAMFDLDSVAVVGASRTGTMGGIILKNLQRVPRVYPINPKLETVQGQKCFASLSALPEVPDAAVFAVNPAATVEGFEELTRQGGKGAIIVTDGFSEVGLKGLEDRLVKAAREHGAAYLGPNCMGVIDNFSGLNTMFLAEHRTGYPTEPGGIGVISQSGGIGVEFLEMAQAGALKLGKWVSVGNASSVGVAEVLDHMGRDDRIKAIAIYLEGLDDGLKLMEVGRRVTAKKPVLIIKGGLGGGAEATLSHTASLAGSNEAFRACCRKAGFHLIQELTEDPKILINIMSILTTMPPAKGSRVGVVSLGGGAGILLADQVTAEGMELAKFAPQTKARLQDLLKDNLRLKSQAEKEVVLAGIGRNPLDLFGNCDDDRLIEALRIVDDDPNTDLVLAAIYLQVPYLSEYINERLLELNSQLTKPLVISPRGFAEHTARSRAYLFRNRLTTYSVPMMKPIKIALDVWARYGTDFR